MPKGCAHIASTESTESPELRNGIKGHDRASNQRNLGLTDMNTFAYVQPVSYL